jgi:Zn-dependent peptidase ImmA (M78 family)/DNA-binding XRE family transcriptional regulator
MSNQNIAANLLRLRLAKGLTHQAVAEAAGITRAAYAAIESGKTNPRTTTLQNIAKAIDVKLIDLLTPSVGLKHVRFRANKKLKARPQILTEVATWLRQFNELENILAAKAEYCLHDVEKQSPERLASKVRERLGLGKTEPVRDICGLFEACGIKVYPVKLASHDFFGLSVAAQDGGPAVVVNVWERIPVERWIFSAVHELGHLLLHLDSYQVLEENEDLDEEREADCFAGEFLMPQEAFQKEWQEAYGLSLVNRVMKVKRIFGVSYKTVLYRLYTNGQQDIWKKFQYNYKARFGVTLCREDEPEAMDANIFHAFENNRAAEPYKMEDADFWPERLALLVRMAIEQELITLSRGAAILHLDLVKMRALAASWVD